MGEDFIINVLNKFNYIVINNEKDIKYLILDKLFSVKENYKKEKVLLRNEIYEELNKEFQDI